MRGPKDTIPPLRNTEIPFVESVCRTDSGCRLLTCLLADVGFHLDNAACNEKFFCFIAVDSGGSRDPVTKNKLKNDKN